MYQSVVPFITYRRHTMLQESRSILNNDLYTFTVGQAVLHNYDDVDVEYRFVDRGHTQYPLGFARELQEFVKESQMMRLTKDERRFLESACGHYLSRGYLDWLSQYRFDPDEVTISQHKGDLEIVIRGPWYRTIYWEVPLLAAVSEIYYRMMGYKAEEGWKQRASQKGRVLADMDANFVDFGTRRPFSFAVQDEVVSRLMQAAPDNFKGTSNVLLAMKYGLTPQGTMSHQWIQGHAALFGVRQATYSALHAWEEEFDGYLGTALTDTYTTDEFLKVFGPRFARLYDGVRHDSGDPIEFVDKVVEAYQKVRVNPKTKYFVFSDSLDLEAVETIHAYCHEQVKPVYGIGSFLSNDVGAPRLNIVIKLFKVYVPDFSRWVDVVKLSDVPGKVTGDPKAVEAARYELGLSDM